MQHYAYFLNFLPIQFYKSSKTNNGQVDGACAIVQVNVRERKCKCCQSTLSGPTRGTWALTFSGFGENHTKWLFSYSVQNTFCFNYHLFDLQWLQWGQRPKILMLTI